MVRRYLHVFVVLVLAVLVLAEEKKHKHPVYLPGMGEKGIHDLELFLNLSSGLSFLGSVVIILTGLLFWRRLVQDKLFMKLIMTIAFCDLVGDAALAMGFPTENSGSLCEVQGILIFFFFRSSWIWALAMSSCFFSIIRGKKLMTYVQLSLIVWPLNILFALLPLTEHVKYGACLHGQRFGSLDAGEHNDPEVRFKWITTILIGPMIAAVFIMTIMSCYLKFVYLPTVAELDSEGAKKVSQCIENAIMYPTLMSVCWFPHVVLYFYLLTHPDYKNGHLLGIITFGIGSLYGFFVSISFFLKSQEARALWLQLLNIKKESDGDENSDSKQWHQKKEIEKLGSGHDMRDSLFEDEFFTDEDMLDMIAEMNHPDNIAAGVSPLHGERGLSDFSIQSGMGFRNRTDSTLSSNGNGVGAGAGADADVDGAVELSEVA